MANEQPWFKFYAADYLLDPKVDAMPREAEALLVRMWCICHREGSCPADVENLARKALCTSQYVLNYKPYCEPFFQLEDGKLYSRRMEEEKRKSEIARNNVNKRYRPESESESKSDLGSTTGSTNGTTNHNKKPPRSGERAESDPRHRPIREVIKQWQHGSEVPEQWDGRSAKALYEWLKANPDVNVEQATLLVINRFASDEPLGAPPWEWIPKLTKYWEGPLDKFKNKYQPDFRATYDGMRAKA